MNWLVERRRRRRRRYLVRGFLLGGILLAGLAGLGALQPAERVITRERQVAAPPELVWRVLNDLDGMPLWRSELARVERLPDRDGRPVWREEGRGRQSRLVSLSVALPGRRLHYGRAGGADFPPRSVELVPLGRGTRIVVAERRSVVNPLGRILARLLPVPGSDRLERFLDDLERRLAGARELSAVPE
jgi:hypothetical protein